METLCRLPEFWIDTNVLIEARNGPYGFDIAPGFWTALDELSDQGQIRMSSLVYDELVAGVQDDLALWIRERRRSGLVVEPNATVQAELREIANYVSGNFLISRAASFLRGADPWVIAHAMVTNGVVVTQEARVPDNSTKVKIPNICTVFGVESISTYQMLRELGVSLE